MKLALSLGLMLLASLTYADPSAEVDYVGAVPYVRECPIYGPGYFYIPGSDICEHASTGVTKRSTPNGTVTSETQLAYRVAELERKLALLLESNQ